MTPLPETVPVVHPVRPGARTPGRSNGPFFVAATTHVRIVEADRSAFRPLGEFSTLKGPRRPFVGPGGLWRALTSRANRPIALGRVLAYLGNGEVPKDVRGALDDAFSGTPVAAFGNGRDHAHAWATAGHRGASQQADGPVDPEAGALLSEWMGREFAVAGGVAMVRWRPVAGFRLGLDTGWSIVDGNQIVGLDFVAAHPADWKPLAALAARRGRPRGDPPPRWQALAEHWAVAEDDDLRRVVNMHAGALDDRLGRRIDAIRNRAPEHGERLRVERSWLPLAAVAGRACLGLAGSPGHETDLDAFRDAVAVEAQVAGKAASRTGVDGLHAYMTDVVAGRRIVLPGDDADALDGLLPGRAR